MNSEGEITDHVALETAEQHVLRTYGASTFLPSTEGDISLLDDLASEHPPNIARSDKSAPISTQGVIADDRRRAVRATGTPFSRVVQIRTESNGYCTGFLIGSDDLVTAAHCLVEAGSGDYKVGITTNFQATPDGHSSSCGLDWYAVPDRFALDGDPNHDYAWVGLDCEAGYVFGTFGLRDGLNPGHQNWTIAGYPSTGEYFPVGQQVSMTDNVEQFSPYRLAYFIDTEGGQSGSPIYNASSLSCGQCAIGIHAYGYGPGAPVQDKNSGTYITPDLYSYLMYFRDWTSS